jgi:hypothetical protein
MTARRLSLITMIIVAQAVSLRWLGNCVSGMTSVFEKAETGLASRNRPSLLTSMRRTSMKTIHFVFPCRTDLLMCLGFALKNADFIIQTGHHSPDEHPLAGCDHLADIKTLNAIRS